MLPQARNKASFGYLANCPAGCREEDLHRGNIPKVGEWLEKDSQVRHYMRSYQNTTPLEAHKKSKEYIWDHLFWA